MEQTLENSQKGEDEVRTVSFESEQKQIEKAQGDVEIIELRAGPAMEKQEEEVNTELDNKIERMEEDEAGEAEVGGEAEPEGEQVGGAEAEQEAEPEVELEAEAETEVEGEQEAAPEAESEAEPEAAAEAEPEEAPKAEPEVEAEAELELGPEAEPEVGPEAEPEVGPEAEPATEAEKESEPGAENAEPEKAVDEKPPEDESNNDANNVKEQETNSNHNNGGEEEGVPTGAETQQPNPAETEEKLQNDAPASEVELSQEKPHFVEAANKIKPELCLTCTSKEDSSCGKKATEQVTCKKTNNNNNKSEHSGCYSMFDEKGNTTMRGCVSDLTEEGVKYCLNSKKFCELCYSNICNNKKINGGAADLHKLNIILLGFVNMFVYINSRDFFIVNGM
uniref:DUF753 domain-containing protein n=1 Tax=Glossina austeni TaxID=7395 RepID=A0A1A9VDT3_GLOAU